MQETHAQMSERIYELRRNFRVYKNIKLPQLPLLGDLDSCLPPRTMNSPAPQNGPDLTPISIDDILKAPHLPGMSNLP